MLLNSKMLFFNKFLSSDLKVSFFNDGLFVLFVSYIVSVTIVASIPWGILVYRDSISAVIMMVLLLIWRFLSSSLRYKYMFVLLRLLLTFVCEGIGLCCWLGDQCWRILVWFGVYFYVVLVVCQNSPVWWRDLGISWFAIDCGRLLIACCYFIFNNCFYVLLLVLADFLIEVYKINDHSGVVLLLSGCSRFFLLQLCLNLYLLVLLLSFC